MRRPVLLSASDCFCTFYRKRSLIAHLNFLSLQAMDCGTLSQMRFSLNFVLNWIYIGVSGSLLTKWYCLVSMFCLLHAIWICLKRYLLCAVAWYIMFPGPKSKCTWTDNCLIYLQFVFPMYNLYIVYFLVSGWGLVSLYWATGMGCYRRAILADAQGLTY